MKKVALGLSIAMLFSLITNSSSAVEFGQDATGDPNAVKVGGASGFLYSDRIVFTAAHVIESTGGVDYWERSGVIYTPGIVRMEGQKTYRAKKVLVAPTYRPRVGDDQTRIDDFAIIILQESIPMKNSVVVANTEDINGFIKNKTPVSMIGYGLQNPSQRVNFEWGSFSPMKMTSYMVSNEELRNYYKINANRLSQKPGQTMLDYGIVNTEQHGSVCDGDSGAGFFVETGNTRYYLGPVGGQQAGITNCQSFTMFGIGGGMSGITATNKFLELIKTAEDIVAEDKRKEFLKAEEVRLAAELKAKQEVEAEAKAKADAEAKAKAESEANERYEAVVIQYRALLERIRLLKIKYPQESTLTGLEAKMTNLPIIKGSDLTTALYNINSLNSKLDSSEKLWVKTQKTTITCVKGKLTKKVTAVNPKCPTGYKKK